MSSFKVQVFYLFIFRVVLRKEGGLNPVKMSIHPKLTIGSTHFSKKCCQNLHPILKFI